MRTVIGDLGEEADDEIKKILFAYVMTAATYAFSDNDKQSKSALLDLASGAAADKIYNVILEHNKTK